MHHGVAGWVAMLPWVSGYPVGFAVKRASELGDMAAADAGPFYTSGFKLTNDDYEFIIPSSPRGERGHRGAAGPGYVKHPRTWALDRDQVEIPPGQPAPCQIYRPSWMPVVLMTWALLLHTA